MPFGLFKDLRAKRQSQKRLGQIQNRLAGTFADKQIREQGNTAFVNRLTLRNVKRRQLKRIQAQQKANKGVQFKSI